MATVRHGSRPSGNSASATAQGVLAMIGIFHRNSHSKDDIVEIDGLRVYAVPAALIKVPEPFYRRYPVEAQVVLSRIPDGSGRIARFLMNVMLASCGYPWTVIRLEDRADYLAGLEAASVETDIEPFAGFIAERVRWSQDQVAY